MTNSRNILIGILISILIIGITGCIENTTPIVPTTTPDVVITLQPTPTPTPRAIDMGGSTPYISISYSHKVNEYVGMKKYPSSSGQIYLIVTINIENHGYDNFNLDDDRWFAFIDNVEYSHSYVSHYLDNKFNTQYIKNNGKLSGGMAFEIPKNGINASNYNYRIGYNNLNNYNIKWNKK